MATVGGSGDVLTGVSRCRLPGICYPVIDQLKPLKSALHSRIGVGDVAQKEAAVDCRDRKISPVQDSSTLGVVNKSRRTTVFQ